MAQKMTQKMMQKIPEKTNPVQNLELPANQMKSQGFDYVTSSSNLVGTYVQPYLSYFSELKVSMKKADINMSLQEYISVALVTSVAVFFSMTLSLAVIFQILFSSIVKSIIFSFFGALIFSVMIFLFFYLYPGLCMDNRKKKIDGMVPFATLYMTTVSGGGTPTIAIFRTLAKFDDYGEISKEAKKIVEETDVLGIDILNALKNAAERTPSPQFVDLLWGMRTVEMSGGNLKVYLRERSKMALTQYKMLLKSFQQKLSMVVEIYLTVVMIGSIFFMVLTAIMGAMGGADMKGMLVGAQLALVFFIVPIVSTGIIVFIKGITPELK